MGIDQLQKRHHDGKRTKKVHRDDQINRVLKRLQGNLEAAKSAI